MYTKITANLFLILLLVSFVLSAPVSQDEACKYGYDYLIGKTYVFDKDRDPEGVPPYQLVHQRDLPKNHRAYYPDSFIILNYDPSRLNVHLNDESENKIIRLSCG
ncbi:4411_t:CDS:2 [Ambispora gerdemannii]|uniref:4411_t:CDS:1 n=1 Tax=Ambispora gerdemannii TaxID=144530 RepID=A0A9N8V449_9GLOM|nr:4411_t:CDS:2 [Ambispora gerdemannii]